MPPTTLDFLQIDLPALLALVFACTACGLLGNFLILRRQSMFGDAISHVVLPGLVVGFLIAGSLSLAPMLAGAIGAAALAAVLIDWVHRLGRLEYGAAMGVVFTVMFALGILLLERAAASSVHLDADCVLYGQLEDILWLAPTGWGSLLEPKALAELPREVWTLAGVAALCGLAVALFYKELKLTSFDPQLASAMGIPAGAVQTGLLLLVAAAAVAAFEAVGSILVIAMLIGPAAVARLLTDGLGAQIAVSLVVAVAVAVGGYALAGFGPLAVGMDDALSAPGMIAVLCGLLVAVAAIFAPVHGVLGRRLRRRRLGAAAGASAA